MRLTPIDIKKQTFNRALRGYEPEEVEAFLSTVAKQWEELLAEQDALKRRLYELEGQVQKFKELESILHQTLAQAQQSTASVVENAKREAELIRQEAQMKASQILERAKNEAIALNDDIQRLSAQKHEIIQKLRLLLSSQLDLLNSFAVDEEAYIANQIAARKQIRLQAQSSASKETPVATAEEGQKEMAQPNASGAPVADAATSMPTPSTAQDEPKEEKTTRYEVPVESYKGSVSKRTMNIDEILNSLE